MTIDPIIGVLVFLGAMVINRVLAEKALRRLSTEEKARLLDSFSNHRIYSMVLLVILVLLYVIASKILPELRLKLAWGLFGLVILSSIVTTILSYVKLKSLAVPTHYVNNFLIRSCLHFAGLVFLVFTFVTRYFPQ
jgi:hypothetical protein